MTFANFAPNPLPFEEIDADLFPTDCHVCHHERGKVVTSKSKRAALAHRNKEHPWLAQHFRDDKARAK